MAALSYYSNNWAGSFQPSDSDLTISDPELQSLHDMWNVDDGYLVDPTGFLFPENHCNSLLHDFSNNGVPNFDNNLNFLETQSFSPQQELMEPFHYYPKHQKLCNFDELYSSFFDPCLTMLQDYSPPPEFVTPPPPFLPDFAVAEFCMGRCDQSVKKEGGLSAQSVAARQRRRKITVKTQELGKLVPGGQKMNTAEMLQSAYKYIKFLQAQVSLLEFVSSRRPQEVTEAPFKGEEELQNLLESPLIQEKLYSTENCLVPQKLVEDLLPISEKDKLV